MAGFAPAISLLVISSAAIGQQPQPVHFHHLHLNSSDSAAACACEDNLASPAGICFHSPSANLCFQLERLASHHMSKILHIIAGSTGIVVDP
jgi:hypothetical protein